MNTFSRVAIATLTMVGVASAQPTPAPAKAPTPAPAKAAMPAPAKDAKAPTPAPAKAADPKAGAPVATKEAAKPAPAPEMTPPKPPQELTDMVKGMSGTWRCTGQAAMTADGSMAPMTATMKIKSDLDGFWAQDTFEGKMGKLKYKFVAYTTYDAASKKWRRIHVDNMGGQMIGTSDGMKDNKVTYNLDTMGGGGPASMFRDHLEMVSPKVAKGSGEMSTDKGKTWKPVYAMDCKK